MNINFIYFVVGLILLFVIYIAFKAIIRGFEARQNKNFINEESKNDKNQNIKVKNSSEKIIIEIQKLKKLHEEGVLDNNEFKKAKDKILNS